MNVNFIWSSDGFWKGCGPARSTCIKHPLHLGHVIKDSLHVTFATVRACAVKSRCPMIRPEARVRVAREHDSFPSVFCKTFFHIDIGVIMKLT